jgi:hypothetical protein
LLLPASRDQRPRARPAIRGSGERRGRHYPRALCLSRDRRAQRPLALEGCREDLSCPEPVRARTPQDAGQGQQRKDEGGSWVLNSASVIRFRSLHLLIRQPWKDGEHCNRAVGLIARPGSPQPRSRMASQPNGLQMGLATDVSADRSRLDSLGTVSATILDCLQRRA